MQVDKGCEKSVLPWVIRRKISKQLSMFWDFLTYYRRAALWTPWIRSW